jgi:hypothetical protein
MRAYDLRLDLPALAYIDAQLLSLLEQGGTFWDAKRHLFTSAQYRNQFTSEHIYTYKLHSHVLAVSLLYCCIVVPREILDLPVDHQLFRELDAERVCDLFKVESPTNLSAYQLIRLLRNAVAHALFSVEEKSGKVRFTFWTDRPPIFRAHADQEAIFRFLSIAGVKLTNAVLSRK